jgi:hypothetical protein
MGAQTASTVSDWGQIFLTPGSTQTLAALPNKLSLDLLQIYAEGGAVAVNVTSAGVVHKPAVSPTSETLFGRYLTRLTSASSLANISKDVWSQNNANQDVLQVRGQGQKGIYHLDHTLTAYSS